MNQKTLSLNFKSSRSQIIFKTNFFKILQQSRENTCAGVTFWLSYRPRGLQFVKKRLQHRCFLVNIVKFLTTDSSRTLYILFGSLFERELTTTPDQRLQIPKQLQEMFFKKAALKNFAIFTGKHMCLKANNFVKKRL